MDAARQLDVSVDGEAGALVQALADRLEQEGEVVHPNAMRRAVEVVQDTGGSLHNLFRITRATVSEEPGILDGLRFGVSMRKPSDVLQAYALLVPVKLLCSGDILEETTVVSRRYSSVKVRPFERSNFSQRVTVDNGVLKLYLSRAKGGNTPLAVANSWEVSGPQLTPEQVALMCNEQDPQRWLDKKLDEGCAADPSVKELLCQIKDVVFDSEGGLRQGVAFIGAETVVRLSSSELPRSWRSLFPKHLMTKKQSARAAVLKSLGGARDMEELQRLVQAEAITLNLESIAQDVLETYQCNLGIDESGALQADSTLRQLRDPMKESRDGYTAVLNEARVREESAFREVCQIQDQCLVEGKLVAMKKIKEGPVPVESPMNPQTELCWCHEEQCECRKFAQERLFCAARQTREVFRQQLDPAHQWRQDDNKWVTRASPFADVVVDPGLKSEQRVREKGDTKYARKYQRRRYARVRDIVRFALQYATFQGLLEGLEAIFGQFTVTVVENRFAAPTALGWADVTVLVEQRLDSDTTHLVELQLSLVALYEARQSLHRHYGAIRRLLPQLIPADRMHEVQVHILSALREPEHIGLHWVDVPWDKPEDRGVVLILQGVREAGQHHIWSCADDGPKVGGRFFKEYTEDALSCSIRQLGGDDPSFARLLALAVVLLR